MGGLFAQVEKNFGRFLSFVNITTALNGYKKIDYFRDTESSWLWKPGFTFKTGGTYLVTDKSQFFLNLGYISKGRAFKNVFNGNLAEFLDNTDNEKVKAIEGGYKFSSVHFSLNVNSYFTVWENKPPDNTIFSTYILQPGDEGYTPDDPSEVNVYAIIPGMDARHMGVEADFIIKPNAKLELQGTLSLGDWIWTNSVKDLQYFSSDKHEPVNKTISFDASGIHVGNAAQNQIGSSVRYMPFKGYYLTLRQTYYGKYYSNFSPEATVDEEGNIVDSWKIPSFNLFDFHTGYGFKLKNVLENTYFNIKLSVLNILDTPYIWDATNNDGYGPYSYKDFDAKSATVFFGMGRRYSLSFKISF